MEAILNQYRHFCNHGGFFEKDVSVLSLGGKDSADFLHRISTQDFKNLSLWSGCSAALLNSDSTIVNFFVAYRRPEGFLLVTEKNQGEALMKTLDKFHFAEDLEIKPLSLKAVSIQGASAVQNLRSLLLTLPSEDHSMMVSRLDGSDLWICSESDFSEAGLHLYLAEERLEGLKTKLEDLGIKEISPQVWRLLRLESGHVQFGIDVTEKNLVLEAPLEGSVSRNKGCYPGQEVVERIFTYRHLSKRLVGLICDKVPQAGTKVYAKGIFAGTVRSAAMIPWSGTRLAVAVLQKPHYEAETSVQVGEGLNAISAKVVELPRTWKLV